VQTLKTFLWEFWLFGLKQASASVFGGYLLFWILLTKIWYPIDDLIYRNDFLLLMAVLFQAVLLTFRLEKWREACVIAVFHFVATAMEVFKTSDAIGAWQYPGKFVVGIGNVPLFAGFMYSAVGSYIARVWRIFDFRFTNYPPIIWPAILVTLIYINFFTHHFWFDLRYLLLIASFLIFGFTNVCFKMEHVHRRMPLVIGCFLVALFIWIAENIATYSKIWVYPTQDGGWQMVSVTKLLAWYLLMLLSFVLVSLINYPIRKPDANQFALSVFDENR
jgi:uncharacterized membrane protein YoaT (DUF817 family)